MQKRGEGVFSTRPDMTNDRPLPIIQGFNTLRQQIWREIGNERQRQLALRTKGPRGWITISILAICVTLNIVLFFVNDAHPVLFIVASYFLFMGYFLTLLIPLDKQYRRVSSTGLSKTLANLRGMGILRGTDRFSRIFVKAFLINCRTLFIGFALLFSIDILFAIIKFRDGMLPAQTTGIVIFQSASIIIFYFFVWKLEPYSREFFEEVSGVKQHLIRRRIPRWVVTLLLWLLAALAIVAVFSTVILLPGITVKSVLSVGSLEEVGDQFIRIAMLFTTQYFIIRYIHGVTSRSMAEQFSETKAKYLTRQIGEMGDPGAETDAGPSGSTTAASECPGPEILCAKTGILLEAQIYQIEERTLWGAFPVYIVNPDFSVIFDKTSLDRITGLAKLAKPSPEKKI